MIFTKVRDVKSPTRGTDESAGLDFYVPNDVEGTIFIYPGESVNIPSGIKLKIEIGKAGIFFNKSGVGVKGLLVGACVVDSDYRGEVHLNIHNTTKDKIYQFEAGQKLVQMLIMQVDLRDPREISNADYESFAKTQRGTGGFGSTGA